MISSFLAELGRDAEAIAAWRRALEYNPTDEGLRVGLQMVAACDVDTERQSQARERFGCAVYDDYRAMLDDVSLP